MCKFCEALQDKSKEIVWHIRNHYADDNICEFVNQCNCSVCDGCKEDFTLKGYNIGDNVYVQVSYEKHLSNIDGDKVNILPCSESIQFNFCPICGRQISKTIKGFEYYKDQTQIQDREG